ncbi:hypothetical protein ISN44_As12g040370 [Arabidopsis suecica]|uniref:Uncharacterized protein n=1 Tax=Arabidopsis suecica TaxID=45249 RepID=A0A8T1YSB7_ARASU|nr:hypothetical protein ISN44_As12g040370 [Arabidopsis suecica]
MTAEVHDGVIGKRYGYEVVVLVCVYVAGLGWSWWGRPGWAALEIRSATQSVTVAVSFVFTLAVAQSVPPSTDVMQVPSWDFLLLWRMGGGAAVLAGD